jgi:hypothetical protein
MNDPTLPPTPRAVVFRFKGGPRDGDESSSGDWKSNVVIGEVAKYWSESDRATVGRRFEAMSRHGADTLVHESMRIGRAAAPVSHLYEVVRKQELEDSTIVDCVYRGPDADGNI